MDGKCVDFALWINTHCAKEGASNPSIALPKACRCFQPIQTISLLSHPKCHKKMDNYMAVTLNLDLCFKKFTDFLLVLNLLCLLKLSKSLGVQWRQILGETQNVSSKSTATTSPPILPFYISNVVLCISRPSNQYKSLNTVTFLSNTPNKTQKERTPFFHHFPIRNNLDIKDRSINCQKCCTASKNSKISFKTCHYLLLVLQQPDQPGMHSKVNFA